MKEKEKGKKRKRNTQDQSIYSAGKIGKRKLQSGFLVGMIGIR